MSDRRWVRIIPVAFIMYTIAYVDRTNISLALPDIGRDLHLDPAQQGSAFGLFFLGYVLLQIPGGYLAERWSAKKFVTVLLVVWGLCAVVCGLVQNETEFLAARFLLGVAEGGVWPATLILLSHWFPRTERARANAYWMLCLPAAVVISSPVSGWILGRWGWRAMIISEGALPFLWLIIWVWQIADHPADAGWISSEEREHLEVTLRREAAELDAQPRESILRTFVRGEVLLLVFIYFLMNCGNYGYQAWLPSAIESGAKGLSNFQVGILNAIPYLITMAGMVLNSRHSDRQRERRGHLAAALVFAGVFLLAGVLTHQRPILSFALLALVGAGSYGGHGPFWAIPTETLPRRVAGSAMGLINALGNLGGYWGPYVVGYLNKQTGNFVFGFGLLGAALIVGGVLSVWFLPASRQAPAEGEIR
ncbi:MAG TPA: MFS transporter [Terriglobia bacterium]|nr:MFS transporter [Terriglobia bacterium]